jgi:tetratricopeptide (TPR) repeat protein
MIGRAQRLLSQGLYEEALEQYRNALRSNPNNAQAYEGMAQCLLQLERPDEALSAAERAIKLKSTSAGAHRVAGTIYMGMYPKASRKRDPARAVMHFERALAQSRANPLNAAERAVDHLLLGGALAAIGEYERAERELKASLAINPNEAEAHRFLSSVYAQTGRVQEARAELRRARELNPNLPQARTQAIGLFMRQYRYPFLILILLPLIVLITFTVLSTQHHHPVNGALLAGTIIYGILVLALIAAIGYEYYLRLRLRWRKRQGAGGDGKPGSIADLPVVRRLFHRAAISTDRSGASPKQSPEPTSGRHRKR